MEERKGQSNRRKRRKEKTERRRKKRGRDKQIEKVTGKWLGKFRLRPGD